jgi:hypothetical protein
VTGVQTCALPISDGDFNTFVGFNTGLGANVNTGAGTGCTFIGHNAGAGLETGSFITCVGVETTFSTVAAEFSTLIGSSLTADSSFTNLIGSGIASTGSDSTLIGFGIYANVQNTFIGGSNIAILDGTQTYSTILGNSISAGTGTANVVVGFGINQQDSATGCTAVGNQIVFGGEKFGCVSSFIYRRHMTSSLGRLQRDAVRLRSGLAAIIINNAYVREKKIWEKVFLLDSIFYICLIKTNNMEFLEYAQFGFTEILANQNFRVYKDRWNWRIMCVPYGFGDVSSVLWQGANLIVRTDRGVTFLFDDFNDYIRL